jgi:hypothetical protein
VASSNYTASFYVDYKMHAKVSENKKVTGEGIKLLEYLYLQIKLNHCII